MRSAVCLLVCCLLVIGCDEPFEALQDNYKSPFSIYGYLDASADTQWVRVTPVRKQINLPPVKPDMRVTLKPLQNGNTVVLNDSLILNPDGFHILNAWTTANLLEPGHSYRLRAKRPDGAESHVSVTLPGEFPTPRLQLFEDLNRAIVLISGVERLADVQTRLRARIRVPESGWDFVENFSFSHKNRIFQQAPGEYRVRFGTNHVGMVKGRIPAPPHGKLAVEILQKQIFVASGGPEWIVDEEDIDLLDDYEYTLPEVFLNVENGVGYLVGIVSKSIPFKSCVAEDNPIEIIPCPEEKPLF